MSDRNPRIVKTRRGVLIQFTRASFGALSPEARLWLAICGRRATKFMVSLPQVTVREAWRILHEEA